METVFSTPVGVGIIDLLSSKDERSKFYRLITRIMIDEEAVSDNMMLDGYVIGSIMTTNIMAKAIDGRLDSMDHLGCSTANFIFSWLEENNDKLISLMENYE